MPGSFIPHDTAVAPVRSRRAGGALNDLLLLCGIVLLIASGALAVGVFLYEQFLQTQSASKVVQLQRAEAAFEPSLIEQITRLDDRMHAEDSVLSAHTAPTALFQALNQATLQTVSFTSLDFEAPDPAHVSLQMQGIAQSVNSIALQAELFSKNGVITSPIFSNIARQPDGVHFNLAAVVNPAALNYSQLVAAAAAAVSATQSSSAGSPSAAAPALQTSGSASPASPFGGTSGGAAQGSSPAGSQAPTGSSGQ